MPNQQAALDQVFSALADPTRRAVVARLGRGPASVGELHAPTAMALPSFLQHLAVLQDAGLVRSTKVGRVRTCRLVESQLAVVDGWLAQQRATWERRLDRFDDYVLQLAAAERAAEATPPRRTRPRKDRHDP